MVVELIKIIQTLMQILVIIIDQLIESDNEKAAKQIWEVVKPVAKKIEEVEEKYDCKIRPEEDSA